MSLELKIENLTVAINTLIDSINKQGIRAPIAPMVVPVAVTAAPVAAPVPVAVVAPVAAPIAAPVMPAPPSFVTPQAVFVPQNGAPIHRSQRVD